MNISVQFYDFIGVDSTGRERFRMAPSDLEAKRAK